MGEGATATFTNTAFTSNTAEVTEAPHAVSAHAHRRAGARTPLASTRRARPLAIHHRVPLTRTGSALALRAHAWVIIMAGNEQRVHECADPNRANLESTDRIGVLDLLPKDNKKNITDRSSSRPVLKQSGCVF